MLTDASIPVLDADELARQVVSRGSVGLQQIVTRFGNQFLTGTGVLDRKKLAKLVFSDEKARKDLEAITHPLIKQAFASERLKLQRKGHRFMAYFAPLIFEANMEKDFDAVVLIVTDQPTQLERLMLRDRLSMAEAKARIKAQLPLAQKKQRTRFWLDNNGSEEDTKQHLKELWRTLTREELSL